MGRDGKQVLSCLGRAIGLGMDRVADGRAGIVDLC